MSTGDFFDRFSTPPLLRYTFYPTPKRWFPQTLRTLLSDDAYNFERIALRRGAAITSPGLELDDLSPGLNVIFGSNASGKTTLARAIQTSLWPDDPELSDADLSARITDGAKRWVVEYHRGHATFLKDGHNTATGPEVVSPNLRDRYYLGLHELLAAGGDRFARFIARESAGGYDITAACDALDYSVGALRRATSTKEVEQARQKWRTAQRAQRDVHRRARRLDELNRQLDDARRAKQRTETIEWALEVRELEHERDLLETELEAFPEAVDLLSGGELDDVQRLYGRLEKAQREFDDARRTRDECRQKLDENPLPKDGIDDDIIPAATNYVDRLGELRRRRENIEAQFESKKARRAQIHSRISDIEDLDDRPDINRQAVDEMETLADRLGDVDASLRGYEQLESLMSTSARSPGDVDELKRGVDLLRRWLQSTDESSPSDVESPTLARAIAAISAIAVASAAIGLAVTVHLLWLLLLIAAAAMVWLGWRLGNGTVDRQDPNSRRRVYRRDFAELEIDEPRRWNAKGVSDHIETLLEHWADAALLHQKNQRWESHQTRLKELEQKRDELDRRRRKLASELGLDLSELSARTVWLFSQLDRWQQARDGCRGLKQELATVDEQIRQTLDSVNGLFRDVGFEAADDEARARGLVDALADAQKRHQQTRQALQNAEANETSANQRRTDVNTEIDELFDKFGIENRDLSALERLCDRKPEYDEIREQLVGARRTLKDRTAKLERHPAYSEDLAEYSLPKLEENLTKYQQKADRRDKFLEDIKALEAEIDSAKESSDVETRWANYEQARRSLQNDRRADYQSAIGEVLVDQVREMTRDSSRPEVFHRARRLLRTITHGRYRLELDETKNSPVFRAFDTVKERLFSLDELSSGTRVQLLVAVRVAFVEHREEAAMAPLILDEVLANSDDARVRAIIRAIEQIGIAGRQIFYFTAQRDEVEKWRHFVDDARLDCRFIDLEQQSDFRIDGESLDTEIIPAGADDVPEPGDSSHLQYGRALGVANPLHPNTRIGSVYLWYLIDDVDLLYGLLEFGISRWGQLCELADYDGLAALGITDTDYARTKAKASAIEAILDARSIGRGRSVDRQALIDSGAVSDTFIERVAELCEDVDGDAGALIEALDDGEVARFRSDNTRQLKQFFVTKGYLDDRTPLDDDEIWARVLGASSDALKQGLIDRGDLEALLIRISDGQ